MRLDRRYRGKRIREKLLEDLDSLKDIAQRNLVCPPDFGTRERINKSYRELRDYLSKQRR